MKQNGQVFTPDHYLYILLDTISYEGKHILGKVFMENSCGDGRILCEAVKRYIKTAIKEGFSKTQIIHDLENNFIGYELDKVAYNKCLRNLNSIVREFDLKTINWNIKQEDFLLSEIRIKIDYIVGNPPYIMYKNLSEKNRIYLKNNFESCQKGQFDYCYAFIEKSIEILNDNSGNMSYLIPSSIFKNKFGKNLRSIMLPFLKNIYDYKDIKVFPKNSVSTSIVEIQKSIKRDKLNYYDIKNNKKITIIKESLNNNKWIFSDNLPGEKDYIKLSDICKISNSVATLLNRVFIIKDYVDIDENYVSIDGMYIEKKLLRDAYSARSIKYNLNEKIIFPYDYTEKGLSRYNDHDFHSTFPFGYKYLMKWRNELDNRNIDQNSKWYEYGRSQALQFINKPKLLLSSVITNEIHVYKLSKEAVPYSGFYIVPNEPFNIEDIEMIIKSPEFFDYITTRGISVNGSSLRFSVNDFRSFPLHLLKDNSKIKLENYF